MFKYSVYLDMKLGLEYWKQDKMSQIKMSQNLDISFIGESVFTAQICRSFKHLQVFQA